VPHDFTAPERKPSPRTCLGLLPHLHFTHHHKCLASLRPRRITSSRPKVSPDKSISIKLYQDSRCLGRLCVVPKRLVIELVNSGIIERVYLAERWRGIWLALDKSVALDEPVFFQEAFPALIQVVDRYHRPATKPSPLKLLPLIRVLNRAGVEPDETYGFIAYVQRRGITQKRITANPALIGSREGIVKVLSYGGICLADFARDMTSSFSLSRRL
jgi:hypothetical protein